MTNPLKIVDCKKTKCLTDCIGTGVDRRFCVRGDFAQEPGNPKRKVEIFRGEDTEMRTIYAEESRYNAGHGYPDTLECKAPRVPERLGDLGWWNLRITMNRENGPDSSAEGWIHVGCPAETTLELTNTTVPPEYMGKVSDIEVEPKSRFPEIEGCEECFDIPDPNSEPPELWVRKPMTYEKCVTLVLKNAFGDVAARQQFTIKIGDGKTESTGS